MKKIIIWIIIAAVLIGGGVFAYKKVIKKKEKPVETAVVQFGTIEQIVSAAGSVKSAKNLDLSFKISGKITEIKTSVGASVKAGDELASVDASDLDSSLMEAEAAVKVAQAQLDEIKSGASQEEIEVQRVSAANAEENLAKAKENADKAIAASQAQTDSQQIVVNGKKQALEDAKAGADNSLKSAYESALDTVNGKYIAAFNVEDAVSQIFKDQDLMDILGNLNYQLRIDANTAKDELINVFNGLKTFVDKANASKSNADIEKAVLESKTVLNRMNDSLSIIYSALLNTQPMVNIAKAELDAYKTSVSTYRTNIVSAVASINTSEQTISSTKISNVAAINAAQQALDSAEALLAQYKASFESTKSSQAASVASAHGALNLVKKQLELKESSAKPETIAVYEARLSQAQASFNSIRIKYSDRKIIAPVDGIIADTFKEEGENASLGEKIVSMIAGSGFEVEVDIPESDIAKVKVNDSCDITLDAFSLDQIFKGSVISIYPAEKIIEGVVYYKAKIIFIDQDSGIKSGMTANVDILTDKKENVLVIPIRFIKETGGKSLVKILMSDGTTKEKEIKKGMRGEGGEVEVVEGLKEGEKLVE